jgi:hypothetical protein
MVISTNLVNVSNHQNNQNLTRLMFLSFLVCFFALKDAITSTATYRELDLTNPLSFVISKKYNKVKRTIFPDLNYYGYLTHTKQNVEINVSKGDFDKYNVGDTVTVYKSEVSGVFMTQYEIKNQMFITLFGSPVSFMVLPAFVTFTLAIIIGFVLLRRKKQRLT